MCFGIKASGDKCNRKRVEKGRLPRINPVEKVHRSMNFHIGPEFHQYRAQLYEEQALWFHHLQIVHDHSPRDVHEVLFRMKKNLLKHRSILCPRWSRTPWCWPRTSATLFAVRCPGRGTKHSPLTSSVKERKHSKSRENPSFKSRQKKFSCEVFEPKMFNEKPMICPIWWVLMSIIFMESLRSFNEFEVKQCEEPYHSTKTNPVSDRLGVPDGLMMSLRWEVEGTPEWTRRRN